MFIWPNGDVTGAEDWDELARLVGERPGQSAYFPTGAPTEDGWARLAARLAEHAERIKPPADETAQEAPVEQPDAVVETEAPRRRGRPPKED